MGTQTAREKYARALGQWQSDAKNAFIDAAIDLLAWYRDVHAGRQWQPKQEHEEALEDAALLCERMVEAIERLGRRGITLEYIKREWHEAARFNNVPDHRFPETLRNDLALLTWALRAHKKERPRGGQPIENLVASLVRGLAAAYHSAFGEPAAFGTGSPFVKFCNDALPDFGFNAPSAPTLRRIVERR